MNKIIEFLKFICMGRLEKFIHEKKKSPDEILKRFGWELHEDNCYTKFNYFC